ncbi:hypothetical protein JX265_010763 [Neoarthrinium moseri]|uniref:Fungal specific transcription n=1 Tax=Neoarthrinium moseri TaxID=1658444 RepID=A0A9P9WE36_9PEZI|nr:uncharacterized protein JN550_007278 [Neoarthrinium moseri]KAI1851680.1 hypothetical protein JX266_003142 [Neoarthrinium moseri]KAI1858670.1 hypothetical protein JX265_010763 [Neoarthrinium moseri]KAI1867226.1 hypothetical protein JN550_007278 [Neoarthrinium moseri]
MSATPPSNPASSSSSQEASSQPEKPSTEKPTLTLPEPPKEGDTINLDVGGEGVKLDHLGPLVVNENGTMSRISNWTEMSEIERQNTLRILGKRNQLRLKKLREAAEQNK